MSTRKKSAVEQSRRKFLKSAAKIAVYTPPAMLAVSQPSFKAFAQSGGSTVEQGGTSTEPFGAALGKSDIEY